MNTSRLLFFGALAAFISPLASAQQPAPESGITQNPARAGDGVQIGLSRHDGVTVSADGAVVTRNGATEKLTKDLLLPSGVTVRPDGIVIMADKTEVPLRTTQILTLEGKIVPLPVDPRVNPGDPRGNGTGSTPSSGSRPAGVMPGGNPGMTPGTSGSMTRSTVFLGGDGLPFMGTLNPDGTLLRADGTLLPADGSLRAVTFAPDGTPSLGTVNKNGSITRTDGTTVAPDGSVLGANGRMLTPVTPNNVGPGNNAAANPAGLRPNATGAAQTNNAAGNGRTLNPPNNPGAANPGSAGSNNPAINPQSAPVNRPGSGGAK